MKLYDGILKEVKEILAEKEPVRFPYDTSHIWKDRGQSELIMLRDSAYELGGSGRSSVNMTLVTTSGEVPENEILLYGPDLSAISGDLPFARIVVLETDDLGEEADTEKAFATIRNIEFVRYHVYPIGYMSRVSSQSSQEQVRVSKRVVDAGISFAYVGGTYIKKYLELPVVKKARIIFVTDEELVAKLMKYAGKSDEITKTLTHILEGLPADCGHCSMKEVCDEVEGMKELHLGKKPVKKEKK